MMLDMDTELQHLISVSMEKMTSGTNSSMAGRGDKNGGKMDLRKALLVAHFLQHVRDAYCEENYEIVEKTFANLESVDYYDKKMQDDCDSCTETTLKCEKGSRKYYLDVNIPALQTSTSSYPSCVTNTDVMVSRISQFTRPLSVSVNTDYVVCCQSLAEQVVSQRDDCGFGDPDAPVFCDELEVSSCCEVMDDDEVVLEPEAVSHDHVILENRISVDDESGSEQSSIECNSSCQFSTQTRCNTTTNYSKNKNLKSEELPYYPLPKKKRPLPKEYLSNDEPISKIAKGNSYITNRSFGGVDITNTIATSTFNTVTMKSKTSDSPSPLCSAVTTNSTFANGRDSPKVVVQLTQSYDSYMPITCSQLYLEKRLSGLTAI